MKTKKGWIAAAALALVAAIVTAFWWLRQGESRAVPSPSVAFAIVDAGERAFEGSPALALTFTRPLDPRRRYDAFIQVFEMPRPGGDRPTPPEEQAYESGAPAPAASSQVSTAVSDTRTEGGRLVSGAWVVGENPRLLFFPHVKPERRYVVRIDPKLAAADGAKLGAEARYSITTGAVPPAYYFASRGMVLPARQNGGLPVITVNVPEVDVQFLRVRDDQLPRFLDQVIARAPARAGARPEGEDDEGSLIGDDEGGEPAHTSLRGPVSYGELDRLHQLADSVYLGRFLTEQKPNKRSVTHLPVESIKALQEPGVYIAIMSQPGRFRYDYQVTYFYVSDLGLHVRLFETGAEAFVSSLTDGRGERGVEISWLDGDGRILARGETDGDGRASFAERPAAARVVLARKGRQVSMIALREPALDLSEFDATGDPYRPVRLFAFSGRSLYRPGEHFHVSVLARDADGRPLPPMPLQAVLIRSDGRRQFTATWRPDARFPGYYLQRIELPVDAPTGFWTLELRADPGDPTPATVFRFGVEEFLPERMKLELEAPETVAASLTVTVRGSYLYGAPASGNRLLAVAHYERSRNPLAQKYPGFEFGDANEDAVRTRQELPETALDEQGLAQLAVDLGLLRGRQSPFLVRTTVSLLESGGRPVVRTLERVVWPAGVLVGVRPLFPGDHAREDATAEFEVIRADRAGTPKPVSGLPVRLYRENREYYWRFDDQRGWHSGFTETDELVETATLNLSASGRGRIAVPVGYGRYRLEILDPETGLTLRYRFYAGFSARDDETQGVRPDRVALRLDKPAYQPNTTARLTLTPPHAGEALITVEGDRLLWLKRLKVPARETTVEIPIGKDWNRHDLYVSALVLRPGHEGEKVTPARALGLIHLPMERSNRRLDVALQAPSKTQPDMPLKVKVKVPQARGQKAVVTLSAVDAGILNVTRFATPDPFAFFFAKLRYGADLHDVYGRLIEKMPGRKGKLKFGGDNTPRPTRSLPRKVQLVDLFSGPVELDANGEAEISVPVPDFNGTLRLMAVVATADRFGSRDAEVVVAAPLVAELSTPRFLNFGDTATIALDLTNLSGAPRDLKVTLDGRGGLRIDQAARTVALAHGQKTTLRYTVHAGNTFGVAEIGVKVESRDLRLARSFPLMIQSPVPLQRIVLRKTVAPGETVEIREADLGGLLRDGLEAHLALSDRPPIDVRGAIRGLLRYPYGCAEQTTSTAYPHLFVDEAAARSFGLKPYTREERARMLESAIARLSAYQAPNGGFSLWGAISEYEYWLTAYVTGFLQDARAQGFAMPDATFRKALDFLLQGLQEGVPRMAAERRPAADGTQDEAGFWEDLRYRDNTRFDVLSLGAYVLARESKAPLSALRQMFDARSQAHSGLSLVQLGIALKLMGDDGRGDTAIAEGVLKPREEGYWWGDYGSEVRDAALAYALLERHKIRAKGMDNLIATVAAGLARQRYYSTQEQLALFLMGRTFAKPEGGTWRAVLHRHNGSEALEATGTLFRELTAQEVAGGMRLSHRHGDRLYAELSLNGYPAQPLPERKDPITLQRRLYTATGAPLGERALEVGETVLVRLTVRSRVTIPTGLVVDKLPAGIEIENLNIVEGEGFGAVAVDHIDPASAMADRRIRHVEFRDDRFVAAVQLDPSGPVELFYRARVVTPGRFVIPAPYAEDMYRPALFGVGAAGGFLTVTDAAR